MPLGLTILKYIPQKLNQNRNARLKQTKRERERVKKTSTIFQFKLK